MKTIRGDGEGNSQDHRPASVFGSGIVGRLRRVPMGQVVEITKADIESLLLKAQVAQRGGVLETGKRNQQGKHTHADDLQAILSSGSGVFFGRNVKLI
jgi:hypothetical protein